MEIWSTLLGIVGFGIGIPIGLFVGFFLFIYFDNEHIKEPIIKPINELDVARLIDISQEIPMWTKHPDFERIDWLNRFISEMWPYLDNAICGRIRSIAEPMFSEYSAKFHMSSIEFDSLSLGTMPPVIHGIKVHETHEKELVIEPAIRWAGNPNMRLVLKFFSIPMTVQLLEAQVIAAPRITLKPLVPAFPCFASVAVSLLEKPFVDFGVKVLGADLMAIPGLYPFIQDMIGKQIASLYMWPQTLDIQILDGSVGAMKKPVGILHVKIVRAMKLLKMDLLGTSDPYVQLSLSGERIAAKKTSVKMKNLNPEWNEEFKLTVKDPKSQFLQLHVYDWEKVGKHDKLGMQVVPMSLLTPHQTQEFRLDLVKNTNTNDPHNRKHRGKLVVELTYKPFKEDSERYFSGPINGSFARKERRLVKGALEEDTSLQNGGLLLVNVYGAENVEGKHHNNPFALVMFRGEHKRTKSIKKTRYPIWNEEFQFVLEEAPLKDRIHIEVKSKRTGFNLRPKEALGYVDINLIDVVYNGRINQKYHLINSRNGVISVDIRWRVT